MTDEQRSMQENGGHTESQGTECLIERLRDPHEKLKRTVEFVVQFPEPQRALAMAKIAEYLVNSMSLHFLDIMATFQRKAEQEGIDQEEREGTFQDSLSELFPIMMDLSRNISVQ